MSKLNDYLQKKREEESADAGSTLNVSNSNPFSGLRDKHINDLNTTFTNINNNISGGMDRMSKTNDIDVYNQYANDVMNGLDHAKNFVANNSAMFKNPKDLMNNYNTELSTVRGSSMIVNEHNKENIEPSPQQQYNQLDKEVKDNVQQYRQLKNGDYSQLTSGQTPIHGITKSLADDKRSGMNTRVDANNRMAELKTQWNDLVKQEGQVKRQLDSDNIKNSSDYNDYNHFTDDTPRKRIVLDNENPRYIAQVLNAGDGIEPFTIGGGGIDAAYRRMNDDEKKILYYKLNKEGEDSASAYLKSIKGDLNARTAEDVKQSATEYATEHPIASSVNSLLTNAISGVAGVGELLRTPIDENIDQNATGFMPTTITNTTRGTVANNIDNKALSTIYNAGMSMGDMAIDTGIGMLAGNAFGATSKAANKITSATVQTIMSTQSGVNGVIDAKNAGLSDSQAIAKGIADGITEWVTEKYSIEAFLGNPKKFVPYLLKNFVSEGSEEAVGDVINAVTDKLIMGDKSQFMQTYNQAMVDGKTSNQAFGVAMQELAGDMVNDFAVGGLAGLGMAGIGRANYDAKTIATGNNVINADRVSALKDTASQLNQNSDAYQEYAKLFDKDNAKLSTSEKIGDNIYNSKIGQTANNIANAYKTGELFNSVNEAVSNQFHAKGDMAYITTIAKEIVNQGGNKDTALQLAQIATKTLNGEEVTNKESKMLNNSEPAMIAMDKFITDDGMRNDIIKSIGEKNYNALGKLNDSYARLNAPVDTEVLKATKESKKYTISDDGKTKDKATGEEIKIDNVVTDDKGKVTIEANNKIYTPAQIAIADDNTARVLSYAQDLDENVRQQFVQSYEQGQDADSYYNGYKLAMEYGQHHLDAESAAKVASTLTAKQAVSAYSAGLSIDKQKTMAQEKVINNAIAEYKKSNNKFVEGTFDSSAVKGKKVPRAVTALKYFSQASGINITLFDDADTIDSEGIRHGANGFYDKNTNTIHININAGIQEVRNQLKDSVVTTMSHESVHWMAQHEKEGYAVLRDTVLDTLNKDKSMTTEQRVAQEIKRNESIHGNKLSTDDAIEEIVARACEDSYGKSEYVQELISTAMSKDATFAEKFKDALHTVVENIKTAVKKLLGTYESNSEEAKLMREYCNDLDAFQKQFDNALKKAIEINQANMKKSSNDNSINDVKFSYRGINEDGIEVYETSNNIKQLSYKKRKAIILNMIRNQYYGRTAKFNKQGKTYYATINYISAKKAMYGDKKSDAKGYNAKINVGADGNYFELVENSIYDHSSTEIGKKTNSDIHDNVNQWDYYIKTIMVDNNIFDVLINVADKGNNQYVYDVTLNSKKNNRLPSSNSDVALNLGKSVDTNVSQNSTAVNTYNMQKSNKNSNQMYSDREYEQAVKNDDMETAQKMVDETAKNAGYNIKAYHGTPNGTFTVFKGWQYFTESKEYADVYQNQGASSNGYKQTANNPKTYDVYLKTDNVFDTRNSKEKSIFMNEYYRQYGLGSPLSDNGLPDWTEGDDLIDFFDDKGYDYDSIALDEGATGGYGEEVKNRGISYVIKDSNQIKSADAIVKDDKGNIIPLSKRFNSSEDDIRYSDRTDTDAYSDLGKAKELEKRNKQLYETVQNLKRMMKLRNTVTNGTVFTKSSVRPIAADIVKMANSTLKVDEVGKELSDFYTKMAKGELKNDTEARLLANKLLDNSRPIKETNDYFADMKKDIRSYRIAMTPQQIAEVTSQNNGTYKDFQRRYLGKINFTKDGTPIQTVWDALAEKYPEQFTDDISELDRPQAIIDTYNMANDAAVTYKEYDRGERVDAILTQMYDKSADLVPYQTVADTHQKELQSLREKHKENIEALRNTFEDEYKQKSKENYNKMLKHFIKRKAEIKQDAKEQVKRYRDARVATMARDNIAKIKKTLSTALTGNSKTNYVPEELKKAIIDICDMIDITPKEGTKAYNDAMILNDKLAMLKVAYDDLKPNPDSDTVSEMQLEYNEAISYDMAVIRKSIGNVPVKEMSNEQLDEVVRLLRGVVLTLRDARYQIGQKDKVTNIQAGTALINEQQKIHVNNKNLLTKYNNFISNNALSTMRAINRIAGYNENSQLVKLFNDLNEGVRISNMFSMKAHNKFEKLITGENAKTFEKAKTELLDFGVQDIHGNDVKLTRMQAMQIILSNAREQADPQMIHMEDGGCLIADTELLHKGKYEEAISKKNAHLISADGITKIINSDLLNKWCHDYMAVAKEFFNGMSKDAVNEVTLALYHRYIANTPNYIPFEVDKNFVTQDITDINAMQRAVTSMGMLNATRLYAAQPICITGLDSVLDRHIDNVSKLYGLAVPVRNFNKAWNIQLDNATSVKSIVEKNWGKDGIKTIEQAVKDIQCNRISEKDNFAIRGLKFMNTVFVESALMGNISVAIKQAASLPTAYAILDYRSAAEGLAKFAYTAANFDKICKEIDEHTAQHWMRRQGLSTQELGDMAKSCNTLHKIENKIPTAINPRKWIQGIDCLTTAEIWLMAKEDVEKHNKGIEVGSDEYWSKVTNLYDKVIEDTQPMYDTLHRPELLKTQNQLVKQVMVFRTQPLQNAGIIFDAYNNLVAKTKTKDKVQIKEAKIKFIKSVSSQLTSAATFTAMTLVASALLHKMKKYKDDDEELTAQSIFNKCLYDFGNTLSGVVVPIGLQKFETWLSNMSNGNKFFWSGFLTVPVVDTINQYMNDANKVFSEPSIDNFLTMLGDAGTMCGIPVTNLNNIAQSFKLYARDIGNGEFGSFNADTSDIPTSEAKEFADKQYEKAYKARRKEYANETEEESQKSAQSTARSKVTSKFKVEYLRAYKKGDKAKMEEVKKALESTGMYEKLDKTIETWVKNYEKTEAKKTK